MIPYVETPSLTIAGLRIGPFEPLVAAGLVVGYVVFVRAATRWHGVEPRVARHVLLWAYFWGFVAAHLVAVLAYHPADVWRDPTLLVRPGARGIASTGGIVGGLAGGAWAAASCGWPRRWMFFDPVCFAFPFGWIFGRAACALAHDHVGIRSRAWLAVRFPDGPRYDLGLLELAVAVGITAVFVVLGRRRRPDGFFAGLFFVLYAPARIALDELRAFDQRWAGLTFAQWFLCAALPIALVVLARALRHAPASAAPASASGSP